MHLVEHFSYKYGFILPCLEVLSECRFGERELEIDVVIYILLVVMKGSVIRNAGVKVVDFELLGEHFNQHLVLFVDDYIFVYLFFQDINPEVVLDLLFKYFL